MSKGAGEEAIMKRTARVTVLVVGAIILATALATLSYSLGSGALPKYSAAGSADAPKTVTVQRVGGEDQLAYGELSSQEPVTAAGADGGGPQASALPSERLLIVTASMDVRVDDLDDPSWHSGPRLPRTAARSQSSASPRASRRSFPSRSTLRRVTRSPADPRARS